jgi:hypothetical protein
VTLLRKELHENDEAQLTKHNYSWARLVLALGLVLNALAVGAAPPQLKPLFQGNWPTYATRIASDVKVVGNYAYVTLGEAGLAVIDVSIPAAPLHVGSYNTSKDANRVAVSGGYAYVADREAGLQVIDVSDPTNCVAVGGYDTSGSAAGVAISGNYAYIADYSDGLQVIDVSDPTKCVWVGGCDTDGCAIGVAVSGNYAYVADLTTGLQVIDVSDPTNCVWVGSYPIASAEDVAVSGNYAYIAGFSDGLQVIDVSVPTNCVWVGEHRFPAPGTAYGVAVPGGRIYVANGYGGLEVLCTLPDVQFMLRVDDAALAVPCVIEASPVLGPAAQWTPIYTNASPSGPFEFRDFDVRIAAYPQKFYRARQP